MRKRLYHFRKQIQSTIESEHHRKKYVLCAQFCQRLWIVILGYPLRFCLTFIDMWLLSIVWFICGWKGSQCPVPHLNLNDCQNGRSGDQLDDCAGDTLCVVYVLRLLPVSIGDSISSTFWVVTPWTTILSFYRTTSKVIEQIAKVLSITCWKERGKGRNYKAKF
jgi:hypothetical protein